MDETIISLKALHQLAVLEISNTRVSNTDIAKSVEALGVDEKDGSAKGSWRLRCLRLANTRVDTMVEPGLIIKSLIATLCGWYVGSK